MHEPTPREFALATLGGRGLLLSALLLVVAPWLILAGSFIAQGQQLRSGLHELTAPLICSAVWVGVALASRRRRVTLADGILSVRSTFYSCTVPVAALDLAKARLFDREERTELRPSRKRNGVGLPGFKSGHFTLHNGQRAFVAVTSGRWRLWLPRSNGPGLLLEPENPRALLQALHAVATTHPGALAASLHAR